MRNATLADLLSEFEDPDDTEQAVQEFLDAERDASLQVLRQMHEREMRYRRIMMDLAPCACGKVLCTDYHA